MLTPKIEFLMKNKKLIHTTEYLMKTTAKHTFLRTLLKDFSGVMGKILCLVVYYLF